MEERYSIRVTARAADRTHTLFEESFADKTSWGQRTVDLSELAGYGYHNGPVFSAYRLDQGSAMARGGRYDGIGGAFGRSRPATGFDVNLKLLLPEPAAAPAVWVPLAAQAPGFVEEVRALRLAGDVVICALSAQETPPPRCDRVLVQAQGGWAVQPLT